MRGKDAEPFSVLWDPGHRIWSAVHWLYGGFPILGVLIIRVIVFLGLYVVPLFREITILPEVL